jgi:replicative DNA helicase
VIDDRGALAVSQVRSACKRWRDHYGDLGLVVVDYLGLMRPDRKHGTREQEVAEMSGSMKALAKELKCPVLLLSQLNRGLEQRPNKRPVMSDLRESGAIEQDADMILFLYRDEVYHPENEETRGIAEIIIGKQREGSLGTEYAAARLDHARMDPLTADVIARLRAPAPTEPKRKPKSAMEMM